MRELMNTLGPAPQSEPIPGREADMAENRAGGYAFTIDRWAQFDRFLMLGTAGGTYYASEREMSMENAGIVRDCIAEDGARTIERIVEISTAGRAPKNDQAIFALALCACSTEVETRRAALAALPRVCRIGTHLFMFVAFLKAQRGFGRAVRNAIGRWYTERPVEKMAEQVTKYRNRHGWTHRDILRIARPHGDTAGAAANDVFRWITHPDDYGVNENTPQPLAAFLALQDVADSGAAAGLIAENPTLSHEMVPTEFKDAHVWQALIDRGMPMTALMRNLPTMTRLDLLKPLSDNARTVAKRLTSAEDLRGARVHPINALIAHKTYAAGRSLRGRATWEPTREIADALEGAFHAAFDTVERVDKRIYVGVDVSGSMTFADLCDVPDFTPLDAAAALACCYARQFERSAIFGFSSGGGGWARDAKMLDLGIGPRTSLSEALDNARDMGFGGTDCALPMIHARGARIEADAFVILTDNETWAGNVHPADALRQYRHDMGIDAKLVVCAMTSTGFSIADPKDGGMVDVVGFDTAVPRIIENFVA